MVNARTGPDAPALKVLRGVSAQIGSDPMLVQAGGGNTSIKDGSVLWVKASGHWLARARAEPMFVPLSLTGVRAGIAAGDADPVNSQVLAELNPHGLRPSIETTLHALMPHPAVLHVHAVEALARLVRSDAPACLETPLAGLRWGWVPYVRPGLPLAHAVAALLEGAAVDVVALGNHGLVIGGDSLAAARRLLGEVVRRLASPARSAPPAMLLGLAPALSNTRYRLPPDGACHALATDGWQRVIAAGGALYPDHVVFLGGGLPVIELAPTTSLLDRVDQAGDAPALLVAGAGVLVHEAMGPSGHLLLRCLADVAARIPPSTPVNCLPDSEVSALQNWDAEKYRRQQT